MHIDISKKVNFDSKRAKFLLNKLYKQFIINKIKEINCFK